MRTSGCKDEKCKARVNLRKIVETDNFFSAIVREAFSTNNKLDPNTGIVTKNSKLVIKGDGNQMFTFFKEEKNIEKLQAIIKKKVGLYKKDIFKTFVDQLIDGNTDDEEAPGTRLFCINAGTEVVQSSLGVIVDEPGSARGAETSNVTEEESKKSSTTAIPKGDSGVKIDRCHLVSPIDPAIKNTTAQQITSEIETESKSKDEKTGEKKKDPGRASVRDFSGKNYKFYFIYFGDIVELACKNAGFGKLDLESSGVSRNKGFSIFTEQSYFPKDENNGALNYPLKNGRVLLGPLEYYDNNGDLKTINLAQFPISFNFFRAWFMKKVVRRRRPQMPLGAFLASLINDLVKPALGVGMPKSFRAPRTESSILSLTLPGKQGKAENPGNIVCGQNMPSLKEMLPMKQIIDVNSAEFQQEYFSLIADGR